MTVLTVYVPRPAFAHNIVPGSAVVGQAVDAGWIDCYYEGNVYNIPELRSFSERVRHAADRLIQRYPTVARATFRPEDLIPVGTYVPQSHDLSITDQETLDQWLIDRRHA